MARFTLTSKKPESEPFFVSGEVHICAKGQGQFKIMRKFSHGFEVVTDQSGVPMVFIPSPGSDVIFNSFITCNRRMEHKIVADTPNEIVFDVEKA
jgi:hypothetical protein